MSNHLPNPNLSSPELAPDMPKLKMSFYLSAHRTAEDFEGMADHLQDAHIYFYENCHPEITQLLQDISDLSPNIPPDILASVDAVLDGIKIDGASLRGRPTETIIRNIYGTGIVIGELDVSLQDWHIRDALAEHFGKPQPVASTFTETLDALEQHCMRTVELQTAREQSMMDRFSKQVATMVAEHPRLQNRPQLNIAATLGAYHTGVYHGLARTQGMDAVRTFRTQPHLYDFSNEAMRSIAFGIPPTQKLLAQAYLCNIMSHAVRCKLDNESVDWDTQTSYLRNVIAGFSLEDIERIYEKVRDQSLSIDDIEASLVEKGLGNIPKTKAQFLAYAETRARKRPTKKLRASLGSTALPQPTA